MKRFLLILLFWPGILTLLFTTPAQATKNINPAVAGPNPDTLINGDGQLDPTFGNGGIVTTDFGTNNDWGQAVAVQSDGKVILAGGLFNGVNGDIGLARFRPEGTPDPTFGGSSGMVITDLNGRHDSVNAMVIQPDGRIIIAGASYSQAANEQDFMVLRYNPDGTLDTTFSDDGWTLTDMGANFDNAFDVILQPDGKIIVVGVAEHNGQADFAVARYQPDGALDTTFDSDGKVTTDLGSSSDWAFGAGLQSDGKIVVSGMYYNGNDFDFASVRYETSGTLDTSYDNDGIITTDINQVHNRGFDMLVQDDGKIVVAGYSHITADSDGIFTLARYNTDGVLDQDFGTNGIVLTPIGSADVANAVAQQTDGKLILVGDSWNGTNIDVAVARYLPDGALDPDFGSGGIVTTDIDNHHNGATSLALQPDGKIVVAGYDVSLAGDVDMSLMRYLSTPPPLQNPLYIPVLLRE